MSLILGDSKNDRIPREIAKIVLSGGQSALLQAIERDLDDEDRPTDVYVVAFSDESTHRLRDLKALQRFNLTIVNAPKRRHAASLVAIADQVKRIRDYHLKFAVDGNENEGRVHHVLISEDVKVISRASD